MGEVYLHSRKEGLQLGHQAQAIAQGQQRGANSRPLGEMLVEGVHDARILVV
jgi:hypothetical protein